MTRLRSRRSAALVAAAVVALLATALVTVARRSGDDPVEMGATPVSPTAPTSPTTSEVPGRIDEVVRELQTFVERERGLRFKQPVDVTLLDADAFRTRVLRDVESDAEELDEIEGVLVALGLLPGDVDLKDAVDDLIGEGVAGFYDPETDELVVRGVDPTPFVRQVLVHELTHALQDQHFELHRPALEDRDDEAALAFSGLVEGDAVDIERRFVAQLSGAERRAAEAEELEQGAALEPDIPPVLFEIFGFPYITGPVFVRALRQAGGQARVDATFSSPPTTSEHLLHPERFLTGETAKPVTPPESEGRVIDEGVVGEMGLQLVLGAVFGERSARTAAADWGGDRYVAWREGTRTCVRASFVMDTPAATSRLERALTQWARARGGATVEGEGPLVFTACR